MHLIQFHFLFAFKTIINNTSPTKLYSIISYCFFFIIKFNINLCFFTWISISIFVVLTYIHTNPISQENGYIWDSYESLVGFFYHHCCLFVRHNSYVLLFFFHIVGFCIFVCMCVFLFCYVVKQHKNACSKNNNNQHPKKLQKHTEILHITLV